MKLQILLIFCLNLKISTGIATCGYENRRIFGYTCRLTVDSQDEGDMGTIQGIHAAEKTDNDVISIQRNKIANFTIFTAIVCEKFLNVEQIHFQKVGVQHLHQDAFKSCSNLMKINFDENKILEVPAGLFDENERLEAVSLALNNLTTLPAELFAKNSQLKTLNLLGNRIKLLPENLFKSLENLQLLVLNQNLIDNLDRHLFADLKSLQTLLLADNKIRKLPAGIFSGAENLTKLSMDMNLLTVVGADAFGGLRQLKFVDLKSNKIDAVDRKLLENLTIGFLDLTDNVCCSEKIRQSAGASEDMNNKLAKCFENFDELQILATTEVELSLSSTTEADLQADDIFGILKELRMEMSRLRDENRELKLQNQEILSLLTNLKNCR